MTRPANQNGQNLGPASANDNSRPLDVAFTQVGVTENPAGSNRGPRVDEYLRCAGLDPAKGAYPWCVAFARWCHVQAGVQSFPRTAGVHRLWELAKAQRVADPRPGDVGVHLKTDGTGHVVILAAPTGNGWATVEGNSDVKGSRTGGSVVRGQRAAGYFTGFLRFA